MSARSKKSVNSDDFGLSLTGSQIGSLSGIKQPLPNAKGPYRRSTTASSSSMVGFLVLISH